MESLEKCWPKMVRVVLMSKLSFVRTRGQDHCLTKDSNNIAISNISSEVTKPIVTTFHIEPSVDE